MTSVQGWHDGSGELRVHHRQPHAPGNAYRDERGARRNGEPVRTRAQQRAVAGGTVREHLRRAHPVPAAPARRRATAGPRTARRPAAAGGDDGRGNPLPGQVVDHKREEAEQERPWSRWSRDWGDASFPAQDSVDRGRTGGCPAGSRKSAATDTHYPAFCNSARTPSSSSRCAFSIHRCS